MWAHARKARLKAGWPANQQKDAVDSPGADREANWLPAPKGPFIAMLRMYWPKNGSPSILNGSWTPRVVKVG